MHSIKTSRLTIFCNLGNYVAGLEGKANRLMVSRDSDAISSGLSV